MRIFSSKYICIVSLLILCIVVLALAKSENDEKVTTDKNISNEHKNIKLDDKDGLLKSKKRSHHVGKKLHKKSKRKKLAAKKKHNKIQADEPTKISTTNPPDTKQEKHFYAENEEYEITDKLLSILPHLVKRKCEPCIWQECPRIDVMRRHCPSGIVRDQCNCCVQCANGVGMPCNLTALAPLWLPPCGDDLECIPVFDDTDNEDLDVWGGRRETEGICSCTDPTPVCGTNNETYDNICEFREAAARANLYSDNITVKVAHTSPCKAGPTVDYKSPGVVEEIGAIVSFRCEISGFPLPRIQWFKSTKIKKKIVEEELPGYLSNAVTQVRGGPGKYQLTTWLTLDRIKISDEGKYICRSTNEYGIMDGVTSLKIH